MNTVLVVAFAGIGAQGVVGHTSGTNDTLFELAFNVTVTPFAPAGADKVTG
jgi:hypothetical protein